jgi:hypothetical protein
LSAIRSPMIGSVNTPRGRNILFLEGVMKDKEDKLIATATARIYGWTKEPETMFELVERDAGWICSPPRPMTALSTSESARGGLAI